MGQLPVVSSALRALARHKRGPRARGRNGRTRGPFQQGALNAAGRGRHFACTTWTLLVGGLLWPLVSGSTLTSVHCDALLSNESLATQAMLLSPPELPCRPGPPLAGCATLVACRAPPRPHIPPAEGGNCGRGAQGSKGAGPGGSGTPVQAGPGACWVPTASKCCSVLCFARLC